MITQNSLNTRLENILGVTEANDLLHAVEQSAKTKEELYFRLSCALTTKLGEYVPFYKAVPLHQQQEFKFPDTTDPKQLYIREVLK